MRLIDAEKYPCSKCGKDYCYQNCEEFYKWLNSCDYNIEERLNSAVKVLLSEKEYELPGIYNSQIERMIAQDQMEHKNEVIDDVVYIVEKEFKL